MSIILLYKILTVFYGCLPRNFFIYFSAGNKISLKLKFLGKHLLLPALYCSPYLISVSHQPCTSDLGLWRFLCWQEFCHGVLHTVPCFHGVIVSYTFTKDLIFDFLVILFFPWTAVTLGGGSDQFLQSVRRASIAGEWEWRVFAQATTSFCFLRRSGETPEDFLGNISVDRPISSCPQIPPGSCRASALERLFLRASSFLAMHHPSHSWERKSWHGVNSFKGYLWSSPLDHPE